MLEEMSGTVGLVSLSARTGVNPHADGRGLSPWRVLGGNLFREVSWINIGAIGAQLGPPGDDTHGQAVLQGCGLSFANAGRGSEAASEGRDSRQTSAASQALCDVQS